MENEITIVLPVRNRAGIVSTTLDSIAMQNIRPLRLIIVDNSSTDATPDVIRQWADSHRSDDFDIKILNEPVAGAAIARNRGLKEVETEYVMFFDSDDIMEFDHLHRIVSHLGKSPDTDLLHWNINIRNADGWTSRKCYRGEDILSYQILHSTLSTQRYCIRTSRLREAGGWNQDLTVWDDYELGIRLLTSLPDMKVRFMSGESSVIVNISDDSLTGPSFRARAESIKKAIGTIDPLLENHPYHQLVFAGRKAILAAIYRREKARDYSKALLSEALEGRKGKERLKLRLLYTIQRIAGSGASFMFPQLFPQPEPAEQTD